MNRVKSVESEQLVECIDAIIQASTKFKMSFIRQLTSKDKTKDFRSKEMIQEYIDLILESSTKWDSFLDESYSKVNSTIVDGNENIENINYTHMKKFLYGKFKYTSIVDFTNALLYKERDIVRKNKEIDNEIVELRQYALDESFPSMPHSIGEVLNAAIGDDVPSGKINTMDATLFNTIKQERSVPKSDTNTIYDSIFRSLNELVECEVNSTERQIKYISNIVDYASYIGVVHIVREFMIGVYLQGFNEINSMSIVMGESTLYDVTEDVSGNTIGIFANMGDEFAFDFNKYDEFMVLFDMFNERLNITPTEKDDIIIKRALTNSLYSDVICSEFHRNCEIESLRMVASILNTVGNKLKQNLLEVIIYDCDKALSVDGNFTASQCKKLSASYHTFIRLLHKQIFAFHSENELISRLNAIRTVPEDTEYKKLLTNISNGLHTIYTDVMVAVIHKMRYLERELNKHKLASTVKNVKMTRLEKPSLSKIDKKYASNYKHSMYVSTPSTHILDKSCIEIDALPLYEERYLYNEYLKTLDVFNHQYLQESLDLSTMIDGVFATLKSNINKSISFLSSQEFKKAVEWTVANKDKISRLEIPDTAEMKVLSYDFESENVSSGDKFELNQLISSLESYDKHAITSSDNMQAFLRKLYPSENICKMFIDNPRKADGQYINYLTTGKPDSKLSEITLKGPDIMKHVTHFVNIISNAQTELNKLQSYNNKFERAMNAMKQKATIFKKQADVDSRATTQDVKNAQSENDDSTNVDANDLDTTNRLDSGIVDQSITKTIDAIKRIAIPASVTQSKLIKDSYIYLKNAYEIAAATAPKSEESNQMSQPENNSNQPSNSNEL